METLIKIILIAFIVNGCTKIEYMDNTQAVDSLKTLIDNSKQTAKAKPGRDSIVITNTITLRDTVYLVSETIIRDTIYIQDTVFVIKETIKWDTLFVNAAPVTLTDIDGNIYNTVKIGSQIWMKENLKTTTFNDGKPIPLPTYTDTSTFFNRPYHYGAYYNWKAVNTGKLCPTGWHVPSGKEWTTLTDYLGGSTLAGVKLMAAGADALADHWMLFTPEPLNTNESGFTALASGRIAWHSGLARYENDGFAAYWWTSDISTDIFRLGADGNCGIEDSSGMNYDALTVRCIKN